MRIFFLFRKEDVVGISGTGFVAEGVQFEDGQMVMKWRTPHKALAVYKDEAQLCAIHCHGRKTTVLWDDQDVIDSTDGSVWEFHGTGYHRVHGGPPAGPWWPLTPQPQLKKPSDWLAQLAKEQPRA